MNSIELKTMASVTRRKKIVLTIEDKLSNSVSYTAIGERYGLERVM